MIKQAGFSLIGAIFILVIVSLLGQYLINITGVQRQTSLLALQIARAYQAANTGIEWGVAELLNGSNCSGNTTLNQNINNFSVTVSCQAIGNYSEGSDTVKIFRISSFSEYGSYGNNDYTSRGLETIVHTP